MSEIIKQYQNVAKCISLWIENSNRYQASLEQKSQECDGLQTKVKALETEVGTLQSQIKDVEPSYVKLEKDYVELNNKYKQLVENVQSNVQSVKPLLEGLLQGADNLQKNLLDEIYQQLIQNSPNHDSELTKRYEDVKPQAPIPYFTTVEKTIIQINEGFDFLDCIK